MYLGKRAVFLVLLFWQAIVACQKAELDTTILPSNVKLRTGDLVFRRGMGMRSYAVISADREGRYSHVGMVVDSSGVQLVVHAVPDEPDFDGDIDRVKKSTLEQFFSTDHAVIGEVLRPQDSARATCAASIAWRAYCCRLPFDHNYDDSDTTSMYCTELVVHALRGAGYDISSLKHTEFRIPGLNVSCYLPSAVAGLPFLQSVASF